MMDRSNSQYDSFLFWRQPIPELALSELEDLGLLEDLDLLEPPAPSAAGREASPPARGQKGEEEDLLSEFSSFTFWRAPLADVDSLLADLHLLL